MFDQDHGDETAGPVGDDAEEVLEAVEKVVRGFDADGDDDGDGDDREEDAGDVDQRRDEHLEVEGDGVHGRGDVADEREGEENGDEFPEAAGGREHGCDDAADRVLLIRCGPGGDVGDGAADSGAEDHEEDRGERLAEENVEVDSETGGIRTVVDGEVGHEADEGYAETEHEGAVGEDDGGYIGSLGDLFGQVFTSTASGDDCAD